MSGGFPVIRVFSWDTDEIASPVGNRTVPGGSFAFKNIVSSGCATFDPNNPASTSGILMFEETQFDLTNPPLPSHLESKVAAITFNVANSGTAISDLRLFVVDDSAFQGSADQGLDRAFVQFATSGSFWAYQGIMPSGAVDRLSFIVPTLQNVFRQDGKPGLVGQDDGNSSEFVYLNIVIPLGTPLGQYGVCGSGLLRFGLVFNFWCNDFILEFGDP
jgi:hypothetical protein